MFFFAEKVASAFGFPVLRRAFKILCSEIKETKRGSATIWQAL